MGAMRKHRPLSASSHVIKQYVLVLVVLIASLCSWAPRVDAFPTGIPASACANLAPLHACSASSGAGGFTLELLEASQPVSDYAADGSYTVRLAAPAGSVFRGLMVSAWATDGSRVGSFQASSLPSGVSLVAGGECGATATVGHNDRTDRTEVVMGWGAPGLGTGDLVLRASVVESYRGAGDCGWRFVEATVQEREPQPVVTDLPGGVISLGDREVVVMGENLLEVSGVTLHCRVSASSGWTALLDDALPVLSYHMTDGSRLVVNTISMPPSLAGKQLGVVVERDGVAWSNAGNPVVVGTVEGLQLAVLATDSVVVGVGTTLLTITGSGFVDGSEVLVTTATGTSLTVYSTGYDSPTTLSVAIAAVTLSLDEETLFAQVSAFGFSSGSPVAVATVTSSPTVTDTSSSVNVPVLATRLVVRGTAFDPLATLEVADSDGGSLSGYTFNFVSPTKATIEGAPLDLVGKKVLVRLTNPNSVQTSGGNFVAVATVRARPVIQMGTGQNAVLPVGALSIVLTGSEFASPMTVSLRAANDLSIELAVSTVTVVSNAEALVTLEQHVPTSLIDTTLVANASTFGTVGSSESETPVATVRMTPTVVASPSTIVSTGSGAVTLVGLHFASSATPYLVSSGAGATVLRVASVHVISDARIDVQVEPIHPLLHGEHINAVVSQFGLNSSAVSVATVVARPHLTPSRQPVPVGVSAMETHGRWLHAPGNSSLTSTALLATSSAVATGTSLPVQRTTALDGHGVSVAFSRQLMNSDVGKYIWLAVCVENVCSATEVVGVVVAEFGQTVSLRPNQFFLGWYRADEAVWFNLQLYKQAWLGFGASEDGLMIGSEAAIANPGSLSVDSYVLTSKSAAGVSPTGAAFVYDTGLTQSGTATVATFARSLSAIDSTQAPVSVLGPTKFIWAHGSSNQIAYHQFRGTIDVHVGCRAAESCSGHGLCAVGGRSCICYAGYAGENCERCMPGFRATAAYVAIGTSCVADIATVTLPVAAAATVGAPGTEARLAFLAALVAELDFALIGQAAISVVSVSESQVVVSISSKRPSVYSTAALADTLTGPQGAIVSQRLAIGMPGAILNISGADIVGYSADDGQSDLLLRNASTIELADGVSLSWALDSGNVTFSVTYPGITWFGLAVSPSHRMTGPPASDAIIGVVGSSVQDYTLYNRGASLDAVQSLFDAEIANNGGSTTMAWTRPLGSSGPSSLAIDPDQPTAFIWALGTAQGLGDHADDGVVILTLSSGSGELMGRDRAALRIAHGVGMFLSFAVLGPCSAICLRRHKEPEMKGSWVALHWRGQLIATLLGAVSLAFAWAAAGGVDVGAHHFEYAAHAALGLTVIALYFFQVGLGLARPDERAKTRPRWKRLHTTAGALTFAVTIAAMASGLVAIQTGVAIAVSYGCWVVGLLVLASTSSRSYVSRRPEPSSVQMVAAPPSRLHGRTASAFAGSNEADKMRQQRVSDPSNEDVPSGRDSNSGNRSTVGISKRFLSTPG